MHMIAKEMRRRCHVAGVGVKGSCECPNLKPSWSIARTNHTCFPLCRLTGPDHVICGCYSSQNRNLKSSEALCKKLETYKKKLISYEFI